MNLSRTTKLLLACSCGLLFLTSACKKSAPAIQETKVTTPPPKPVNYQLVWSDEFDGTSVNTSDWNFETGGNGWGNNEQQYYQTANATVADGFLSITAKKQTVGSNQYTSARMNTANKKTFTYGRIEARLKVPMGLGLWPAFWMLGSNINSVSWPKCGEIDIMEHINATNTIHGTVHYDNNGYLSNGGNKNTTPNDYHTYRIDWTPNAITWYLDDVQYHSFGITNSSNGTEEFHKPFYILLNLAVGGNWPGQTIDQNTLPATLSVDYVRVYKLVD